ncbi:MAG: ABC transporter substrate-binding protein [Propionibacteriaceae bacterium]|nr:ABC transporter substrate-binding protein [Propionibacteriaceae bacterium]
MRIRPLVVGTLAAGLVLSGCVGAPTDTTSPAASDSAAAYTPVTLTNCGFEVTFTEAPKAAVTLNQGTTEVMLALGLEQQMAGTAYLDDAISERWKAAYDTVPVLSGAEYPSKEAFLAAKPDFSYASYSSAFTDKNVGTREELLGEKIPTYISPFGCPDGVETAPSTMESAWGEATDIAKIFGVEERATKLVDEQKTELETLKQQAAGQGKTVFWFDSGDDQAFAGGGGGGPQIILDAVGATNIFADLEGGWENVAWERVVEADPDVIVLAEASWSTVEQKKTHLESDPVLSQLKAVQNKAYITILFSESTPGIRLVDGAKTVADQITKL